MNTSKTCVVVSTKPRTCGQRLALPRGFTPIIHRFHWGPQRGARQRDSTHACSNRTRNGVVNQLQMIICLQVRFWVPPRWRNQGGGGALHISTEINTGCSIVFRNGTFEMRVSFSSRKINPYYMLNLNVSSQGRHYCSQRGLIFGFWFGFATTIQLRCIRTSHVAAMHQHHLSFMRQPRPWRGNPSPFSNSAPHGISL